MGDIDLASLAQAAGPVVHHAPGRFEHPFQCGPVIPRGGINVWTDVVSNVLNCAGQHVDPITEFVECIPGDDEFVFAEMQLARPLTSDPIPLSAGLRAKLSWAACAGSLWYRHPAPSTASHVVGIGSASA